MKRWIGWGGTGLFAAALLVGCGAVEGGDQGSESHWLATCEENVDCPVGECLCGVCTTRCGTALDCTFPLDRCVSAETASGKSCATAVDSNVCGVSSPERKSLSLGTAEAAGCDEGRTSELQLVTNIEGQRWAVSLGEDGYALMGGSGANSVSFVDARGAYRQKLMVPTAASIRSVDDLVRLPDGSFVLSATVDGVGGTKAWVGKLDAGWNLVWETQLSPVGTIGAELALLPDGGVIVADETGDAVHWARIDAEGQILWEQEQSPDMFIANVQNERRMVLTPNLEVRIFATIANGTLLMIRSDLDGVSRNQTLPLEVAGLVRDLVALPDEWIAIASDREGGALSVLDADGNAVFEKMYASKEGAEATTVAFDATRNELLLGGGFRGQGQGLSGTWLIATDMEGNQVFELTRAPLGVVGGEVENLSPDRGPVLLDIAVSPSGDFLATGSTSSQLTYFVVGGPVCE